MVAVEDVKRVKNRLSGAAALFAAPTEDGAEEESSLDSRSKPQVATVRVMRVLKGVWGGQDLRIGSGPIDSCSMSPVHFRFTVGEKAIFLLSEPITDNRTVLRYGGSFCELIQTEAIMACLDRCMAWRQAWLDEMQRDRPQDLAAVDDLETALHRFAHDRRLVRDRIIAERKRIEATIPMIAAPTAADPAGMEMDQGRMSPDQEASYRKWRESIDAADAAGIKALVPILNVPPRILYTLACRNWPSPSPAQRDDLDMWGSLANDALVSREAEMLRFHKELLRPRLTRAGVSDADLQAYMASAVASEYGRFPWFPLGSLNLRTPPEGSKTDPGIETTDAIAMAEDWNRGTLFMAYGMCRKELARLDPERLALIVPRLCGSLDEDARNIGFKMAEYLPGTRFVSLLAECMIDDHPSAWKWIGNDDDPVLNKERFSVLVAWVQKQNPWRRQAFWNALIATDGFRPELIDAAIAEVKAWEDARNNDIIPDKEQWGRAVAMARRYLSIARTAQNPPDPAKEPTAETMKSWFHSKPPVSP